MKNKVINTQVTQSKVFLWNILGSLASAAISTLLLLSVTRTLNNYDSDVFSIAYAVGNLLITVATFQVRDFQATDVKEKYSFNNYFSTRLLTNIVMILVAIVYIFLHRYDFYKALSVFLICLYRVSDALSDVFQGLFQQHERLDVAGKSLFYRNILIFLVFTLALIFTKNLSVSIIVMVLSSFLFIFCFDFPLSRYFEKINLFELSFQQIKGILIESSPLFINAFLLVSIYNQPKYALDKMFEQGIVAIGVQKDFNILFMPVFAMNLTMIFFRPMMTQMAIFLDRKEFEQFVTYRKKLLRLLVLCSVAILVSLSVIGIPILNIIYSVDLGKYCLSFIILLVGGISSTFATVCDNILTVLRKQKLLVISFASGFIMSYLTADILVRNYGILGASYSFTLSMITWLFVSLIIYNIFKDSYKEKK
ncbi:lipopolysaccharide biosynthesis protein [Streptococcus sp. HF-1907]|uniref:lipopolysaccharide biosynthesis protein n=1 Tax=Streptococcus sp. HF-1907 TaxID=2785793 RepID=UPI0018A10833|nr:lipopolysaccharide biosynthesis protein [Streptococcus sp. HF-1907]MBF7095181.1 lipopolysaccharide biosynthesis protein [Streptococcus sp. HF-1907]